MECKEGGEDLGISGEGEVVTVHGIPIDDQVSCKVEADEDCREVDAALLLRNDCTDRVAIIAIRRIEDLDESELYGQSDTDDVPNLNWEGGRRSSSRRRTPVAKESGGEDESDDSYVLPTPSRRKRTKRKESNVNIQKKKRVGQSRKRGKTDEDGVVSRKSILVNVTEKETTCIGCGLVLESLKALRDHAPSCSIDRPFVCSICGKDFGKAQGFISHKRIRHEGHKRKPLKRSVKIDWSPSDIICHYCGKKWSTVEELKKHTLIHFRATESKCEVCQTIIKTPTGLRHHFQVAHLGIQESGLSQKQLMKEIEQGARDVSATPIIPTVPSTGPTPKEVPCVTCDICGKVFWWEWKLEEHKFQKHSGTPGKPFKCEECGIHFKHKSQMRAHLRTKKHTTEKYIICDYCGKGFRRGESLRKHIKRYHPENFADLPRRFDYGDGGGFQWQRQLPDLDLSIFDDLPENEPITGDAVPSQPECPPEQPERPPEKPECPPEVPEPKAMIPEGGPLADTYDDFAPPEEPCHSDYPEDEEWEMKHPPATPMTLSLKRARDKSARDSKRRLSSKKSRMLPSNSSFGDHGQLSDSLPLNVKIEEDVNSPWTLPDSQSKSPPSLKKKKTKKRRKAATGIKCRLGGCRHWATDRDTLATHRSEVHGRSDGVRSYLFKCDHPGCSFRARYQESLDSHRPTHAPTPPTANVTPDTPKVSKVPRRRKAQVATYICTFPDCTKKFYHRLRLNAHIANYHQNPSGGSGSPRKTVGDESLGTAAVSRGGDRYKGAARCRFLNCKFRAVRRSELRLHLLQVHGPAFAKTFKRRAPMASPAIWTHCGLDGCKFRAILTETMETHQRTEHEKLSPAPNFKCTECPKVFSSNAYRQIHMRIKHRQESNAIPRRTCQFCPKDFCNRVTLHLHIRKVHLDAPIFACSFCSKIYYEEDYAVLHEARHSFQTTTPYKCVYENCSEVSSSQEELRGHVASVHDAPIDSRLVCPTCGKEILVTAYPAHKKTHTKEKKHDCVHCEKQFYKKIELQVHTETVHPEVFAGTEKGFTCDICGASFYTTGGFNRHRYSAHPKEGSRKSGKPRTKGGPRKPRKPRDPGDPVKKRKPRKKKEPLPPGEPEVAHFNQSGSMTSESGDGGGEEGQGWMPPHAENRYVPSYSLQQFLQHHQSHPQQPLPPHHPIYNQQHPYPGFRGFESRF